MRTGGGAAQLCPSRGVSGKNMKPVLSMAALGLLALPVQDIAAAVPFGTGGPAAGVRETRDQRGEHRRDEPPPSSRAHTARTMLIRQLLLDKYDLDGNGLIDESEAMRLIRDAEEARKDAEMSLLRRFDTNGDGRLGEDEHAAMMKALRGRQGKEARRPKPRGGESGRPSPPPPPERGGPLALLTGKLLLERFDADGDGRIGPEENRALMSEAEKLFTELRRELLERFDRNGDGKLGREEAETARRTLREERRLEKECPCPDPIDIYLNTHYDMEIIRSLDDRG